MTKAKKILFVTQEMLPFVPETDMATMGRYLPQAVQEKSREIRSFMPKWGIINERRNQLHEVIRLSGINIVVDDTDHPLVIKVASIPAARMQIYFIDNDDYFAGRKMALDADGKEYDDNAERAAFYARGVLETIKKLKWTPDIIHCFGWTGSIIPLYVKTAYAEEPSFRDCKVIFTPVDPNGENLYSFESTVVGGAIPKEFIPAIDSGIQDAMKSGTLGGYPVVGIHANVYDGTYHEVDSSEMAFRVAGSMCFKEAMSKAEPILLEPIMKVEVTMPEEYMGDVIGDINSRRGRIEGMEDIGGGKQVNGFVPLSEMFGYATDLRSRTQGRGNYSMFFERYEPVPKNVANKILNTRD